MRIACFADIHANLPALEAVIADARERGASHVLGLGDVVGYGPQPVEALARFREVASAAVLGNHDAAGFLTLHSSMRLPEKPLNALRSP